MKKVVIGLSVLILILFIFFIMNQRNDGENVSHRPSQNGIMLLSGGVTSQTNEYIVDFDTRMFYHSVGPDRILTSEKILSENEISNISQLAKKAIEEDKSNPNGTNSDIYFGLDFYNGVVMSTQINGPLPSKGAITDLFNLLNSVQGVQTLFP